MELKVTGTYQTRNQEGYSDMIRGRKNWWIRDGTAKNKNDVRGRG
jgi:hypothetical protein